MKDREGRIVDMHYSDSKHHNTLVAQVSKHDPIIDLKAK